MSNQVGREVLQEFIDKVCLGKPELIANAENAFYWFNKNLARGGLYTCIGKGGVYEKIGEAKPAGTLRDALHNDLAVYQDTADGSLFVRTLGDFSVRMVRIDGDKQGAQGEGA